MMQRRGERNVCCTFICQGPQTTTLISHEENRCTITDLTTSSSPSAVPGPVDTNTNTNNAVNTNTVQNTINIQIKGSAYKYQPSHPTLFTTSNNHSHSAPIGGIQKSMCLITVCQMDVDRTDFFVFKLSGSLEMQKHAQVCLLVTCSDCF